MVSHGFCGLCREGRFFRSWGLRFRVQGIGLRDGYPLAGGGGGVGGGVWGGGGVGEGVWGGGVWAETGTQVCFNVREGGGGARGA